MFGDGHLLTVLWFLLVVKTTVNAPRDLLSDEFYLFLCLDLGRPALDITCAVYLFILFDICLFSVIDFLDM